VVCQEKNGDIFTNEAAEFQGGVGTVGSAIISKQYVMLEAINRQE